MKITEYFNNVSKPIIVTLGVLLVLVMGFIDYITGVELAFSIFYLVPITFVAYHAGKYWGLSIAALSALVWLFSDLSEGIRYSNQAIPYWNVIVRFGFFMVVLYLVNELKVLNLGLERKVQERTASLSVEISEREKTEIELKRKSEKLRQLVRRSQNIREEENTNIAREIHDELGQALTAIKIEAVSLSKKFSNNSELVEKLHSVISTVDDIIKCVREISTRLRPKLLDQLGLLPAIEWQLKDIQKRLGINYKLISKEDGYDLSSSSSNTLFRIFQEAITNIIRHSDATNIIVRISKDPSSSDSLVMEIIDNGIGLPENYQDKSQGLGILGMKERANIMGGDVEMISAQDWGTAVMVRVPTTNNKETQND